MHTPSPLHRLTQPTRTLSPGQIALQQRLSDLMGLSLIGLALLPWLIARAPDVCMRTSLSHFFYDPLMGTLFIGLLFFSGGAMIAMPGENRFESWVTSIGGTCALLLAIWPISDPGCADDTFTARPFASVHQQIATDGSGTQLTLSPFPGGGYFEVLSFAAGLHVFFAGLVLLSLSLYCFFVLTRVVEARHIENGELCASKRKRNRLYRLCGGIILGCLVTLAVVLVIGPKEWLPIWDSYHMTYYVEALAIATFAVAWFAKARRLPSMREAAPLSFKNLS